MNGMRIALGLVAGALLTAAPAKQEWEKRISEYLERTAPDRARHWEETKRSPPTMRPPLIVSGPGLADGGPNCIALCPGKPSRVRLGNDLAPRSLVVVKSDDVEVISESQLGGWWEATLRPRPDADPRFLLLAAVEPSVGIRNNHIGGLEIGCGVTMELEVSGQQMRMPLEFKCGASDTLATAEWRRDGKLLGNTRYWITRRNAPHYEILRAFEDVHDGRRQRGFSREPPPPRVGMSPEAERQMRSVLNKVRACHALPLDEQERCMSALKTEAELANAQVTGSFGCGGLEVTASHGTFLDGKASSCSGHYFADMVPVTGRYSSP